MSVQAKPNLMPAKRGDYIAVEYAGWVRVGRVLSVLRGRCITADFGHGPTEIAGSSSAIILGCLPSMAEVVGRHFTNWGEAIDRCRQHRDVEKMRREESARDPRGVVLVRYRDGSAISSDEAKRLRLAASGAAPEGGA